MEVPQGQAAANLHQRFHREIISLQESISALSTNELTTSNRKKTYDQILARTTKVSAELADASGDIPPYHQRSYNQALKQVQDRLAVTQASHAPKPKFSFKNKRSLAAPRQTVSMSTSNPRAEGKPEKLEASPKRDLSTPSLASPPKDALVSQSSEEKVVDGNSSAASSLDGDVLTSNSRPDSYIRQGLAAGRERSASPGDRSHVLSGVVSSIANLTPDSSAQGPPFLTVHNVKGSLLLAPDVEGPAHITNLRDSILVLTSQQFRMHDSHNVEVYLFCSSRPIIENCTNIRFTSLPNVFINRQENIQEGRINMFDQVDDFKWLRAEQSPNWRLMNDDEGVCKNAWSEGWLGVLTSLQSLDEEYYETAGNVSSDAVQGILSMVGLGIGMPDSHVTTFT